VDSVRVEVESAEGKALSKQLAADEVEECGEECGGHT
jgi:hypothetical protein